MKKSIQKFTLFLLLILTISIVVLYTLPQFILQVWWIYSLNIISSLLKIFIIRWLSAPILATLLTFISFFHLLSASKEERKNKKLLFLKTATIFTVTFFAETQIQLLNSLLQTILAGQTGTKDPLLNLDFSFYIFAIPFLQKLGLTIIIYLSTLFAFRFTANTYTKIKTIHVLDRLSIVCMLFWASLLILIQKINSIHAAVDSYVGYLDIYGDLVPFAISLLLLFVFLSFVIIIPQRKIIAVGSIGVLFLIVIANTAWPLYLQKFIYTPNQSALQEKFAGLHAESTRRSFGLDKIVHSSNHIVQSDELAKTLEKNFWQDGTHVLKTFQQNQEVLPIFQINHVNPILLSDSNGEFSPYFIAARESAKDNNALWDVKYFRNIFGYGAVIGSANRFNEEGGVEFVLKDLNLDTNYLNLPLKRPHILFSESYDTPIFINTSMLLPNFTKSDFPLEKISFPDVKGIPVNIFTKIILALAHRDSRFFLTDYFLPDTQLILQRKPKTIVKTIFPHFEYSEPKLIYHNEELWWEMDVYTFSDSIYLSKSQTTSWGKFNWIQSPMKVFVSAYSGEVIFDIFDANNPFIRTTQKLYPQLFEKQMNLPPSSYHYPVDLFNIQSELLQLYHETNAASFYSGINKREINSFNKSNVTISYRMLLDSNRISLQQTYTPAQKRIFAALVSAYIGDNKEKILSMYSAPAQLGIPGEEQAISFLNQDPDYSQKATLWSQGGSVLSTSDTTFYPLADKGIYLSTIYLGASSNSSPLAAQFTIIDSSSVSLGNSIEQVIYNSLKTLNQTDSLSLSEKAQIRAMIAEAYQYYLQAEQARINGKTQEYQEIVDKIGATLQSLTRFNEGGN